MHINPLKHGVVRKVIDWPYSTFHRLVEEGIYSSDWAGSGIDESGYVDQAYGVIRCAITPYRLRLTGLDLRACP